MDGKDNYCNHVIDPLKLVREGTNQNQRLLPALNPESAPIDQRGIANDVVFAKAYAAFIKFYNTNNLPAGDWTPFFNRNNALLLAETAIQEVDIYRLTITAYLDFLDNRDNENRTDELKNQLGLIFSSVATLVNGLEQLKESLSEDLVLKATLKNLIQQQLAQALHHLIRSYYEGLDPQHAHPDAPFFKDVQATVPLWGSDISFKELIQQGLSMDWVYSSTAANWQTYVAEIKNIASSSSIFGTGLTLYERINFIARNNLFTNLLDQFLKAFARVVKDAQLDLQNTLSNWNHHEPHYALFLAFLRLFDYARAEINTLTGRHLDFYYREVLQLKEKPAQAQHALLLAELSRQTPAYEIKAGELLKAGKDNTGKEAFFAVDNNFVANQAKVNALMSMYQHGSQVVGNNLNAAGRIFTAPIANSEDGLGMPLLAPEQSWHPFFNKHFEDGSLKEIRMPMAEIGFAIASHYLFLEGGGRTITLTCTSPDSSAAFANLNKSNLVAWLTTEKGWLQKEIEVEDKTLTIILDGNDPPIVGYLPKTHEYTFDTELPILMITLAQDSSVAYAYNDLRAVSISKIELNVAVTNFKNLILSNDFGPIDAAKPFQPFGARPQKGSALIMGAPEIFQKNIQSLILKAEWQEQPSRYNPVSYLKVFVNKFKGLGYAVSEGLEISSATTSTSAGVTVTLAFLNEGKWYPQRTNIDVSTLNTTSFSQADFVPSPLDYSQLINKERYSTNAKNGFLRISLDDDLGQAAYEQAIISYVKSESTIKPSPPVVPHMTAFKIDYNALQVIELENLGAFEDRQAKFFHCSPFGEAEQHLALSDTGTPDLLPQFAFLGVDGQKKYSEAEFYIGIEQLYPPQNLALLFQVLDGSANPLAEKPSPHLHWSFLSNNNWIAFKTAEVNDQTAGLLKSGVITFSMPREASANNTLLPTGKYWLRAAVKEASSAVCKLILVAAQGFSATFADQRNDPAFASNPLKPGTISQLQNPISAVKKIKQPLAGFGGRGAESAQDFYTRVSERLRHKDRAIDLWDYEHLILETFPQIYQVKCLNHTHYEPTSDGEGIYRELAPGHVTLVTLPKRQFQNNEDSLHPCTSLGVLEEIKNYVTKHTSCFVQLHVKNPQFEELRVKCKVRLMDGFDEAYYHVQVQKAITRYLSPWAFSSEGRPSFGGKVYQASVLNFIEELPYVDYVTDFELFQDINGVEGSKNVMEAAGSLAISILVSAPMDKHSIELIPTLEESPIDENCNCKA